MLRLVTHSNFGPLEAELFFSFIESIVHKRAHVEDA